MRKVDRTTETKVNGSTATPEGVAERGTQCHGPEGEDEVRVIHLPPPALPEFVIGDSGLVVYGFCQSPILNSESRRKAGVVQW